MLPAQVLNPKTVRYNGTKPIFALLWKQVRRLRKEGPLRLQLRLKEIEEETPGVLWSLEQTLTYYSVLSPEFQFSVPGIITPSQRALEHLFMLLRTSSSNFRERVVRAENPDRLVELYDALTQIGKPLRSLSAVNHEDVHQPKRSRRGK